MIAFIFSPLGRVIVGALALLAIVGGIYWKGHNDGTAGVELKIERDNAEAVLRRLEIERDAQPCIADPNCVLPDPFRVQPVRPDPGK